LSEREQVEFPERCQAVRDQLTREEGRKKGAIMMNLEAFSMVSGRERHIRS
jgi:hypothetical protein